MHEGRTTWADLAQVLGLSAPAVADRVRRLERRGMIRGYSAVLNPELVGVGITAFVAVALEKPEHRAGFLEVVRSMPEAQECHHVAGEEDYLLKIRCRAMRDLERVVSEEIKGIPGVLSTRTTVVLSTAKETPVLPIQLAPDVGASSGDGSDGP